MKNSSASLGDPDHSRFPPGPSRITLSMARNVRGDGWCTEKITTRPVPPVARWRRVRTIAAAACASKPDVGSSRTKTSGPVTSSMATDTRRRSPPLTQPVPRWTLRRFDVVFRYSATFSDIRSTLSSSRPDPDDNARRHIAPTTGDVAAYSPRTFAVCRAVDRAAVPPLPAPPSSAPTRESATDASESSSRTASALARLSPLDVNHGS